MSDDAHILSEQSLLPERIENARSLLVVLIIMAFLAGLALLFSRGATRLSSDWRAQLTDTATVQVIHNSAETREAQMTTTETTLRRLLPSAEIMALPQTDAQALLRPWLGEVRLPDDLPVPGLITVKNSGDSLPIARMKAALAEEGIIANIDDHTRFSAGVKRTSRRILALGTALLSLLLGAGLAISIFATRAGLSAQRDIIRVLVQVGASNQFIAKLFIGQAGKRAAIGAGVGLVLAAILWAALTFTGMTGGIGWTSFGGAILDLIWLIGLGGLFALICALAAGATATKQLTDERRRK